MDLELSTKTDGGRTVVSVSGEIDMYTAPTLREYLTALLSDGVKDLAIDVNGVDFCDSTGLGSSSGHCVGCERWTVRWSSCAPGSRCSRSSS